MHLPSPGFWLPYAEQFWWSLLATFWNCNTLWLSWPFTDIEILFFLQPCLPSVKWGNANWAIGTQCKIGHTMFNTCTLKMLLHSQWCLPVEGKHRLNHFCLHCCTEMSGEHLLMALNLCCQSPFSKWHDHWVHAQPSCFFLQLDSC